MCSRSSRISVLLGANTRECVLRGGGKHRVLFAGIPEVWYWWSVWCFDSGGGLKGKDEDVLHESHEGRCGVV